MLITVPYYTIIRAAVCLLQNEKGENLFTKRSKEVVGAEKIQIGCGGKLDIKPGTNVLETYEEACIRETQEEIGITPINLKPFGLYTAWKKDHALFLKLFTCTMPNPKLSLNKRELTDYYFIPLMSLPLYFKDEQLSLESVHIIEKIKNPAAKFPSVIWKME